MATPGPSPKLASTIAINIQAAASSIAPAESDRVPIGVPDSPRSWMIRASMGKAVIAMAAPMNSVASNCVTSAVNRPDIPRSQGAMATATRKGAAIPASETAAAPLALAPKPSRSNPSPTMNMYSPTPSCAPTNRMGLLSGGNSAACTPGARAPSSDGPSSTPAIISPTTWGCPR